MTIGLINMPSTIFSFLVNTFFMFCMVCPRHGQQIKQPLKLLLGTLICCTITCMMSFLVHIFMMTGGYTDLMLIPYLVYAYTFLTSMSSSVWLNFFFYAQIVPAQRAVFIWIKKNIKPVIYCLWLFDKMLNLLNVCTVLIDQLTFSHFISGDISYNFTIYNDTTDLQMDSSLKNVYSISLYILGAYTIFSLCVMVLSSGSTVFYLCKHMCRMVANGQPPSCSLFRSQVRVTITGILQGILYVFCTTWSIYCYLFWDRSSSILSDVIAINLYTVGTTFNLGAGQREFRQRTAEICHRAVQWFKGPDVQQSDQAG